MAYILAVIFHPIFVPIYLFMVLTEIDPVLSLVFTPDLRFNLISLLMITMVGGPVVSIYILKSRRMIDSLHMPTLKGRTLVYAMTAIYYAITYLILKDIELPRIVNGLFFGLMAVLFLLAFISLNFKISAHMAGVGGAVGAVLWVFWMFGIWDVNWILGLVFLSALVATSRLYLQAHSMMEVFYGFALGIVLIFFTLFFYVS